MPPEQDSWMHRRPCRFFNSPNGCRYGLGCKFLHEVEAAETSRRQTNPSPEAQAFYTWRRAVPRTGGIGARLPISALKQFFRSAEEMIGRDASIRQNVVTELASEGGLGRINELATQKFDNMADDMKVETLQKTMLPLFRVLSHPEVLTSPVLEQQVATLHNYLYGVSGKRLNPILDFIANVMPAVIALESDCSTAIGILDATSCVVATLLDINSNATIDNILQQNVQALAAACPSLTSEDNDARWAISRKHFARIQRHLDLGLNLPTLQPARRDAPSIHATFHVQRRPPGGRHDNDHPDICRIRILPTISEITSVDGEYLPTTDPTEHHLDGVDGLLDRQFRLLREDTVGQLRDAVQAELRRMQGQEQTLVSKSARQHTARTHVYRNVRLIDMGIQHQELCIVVDFDLPQHMTDMKPNQLKDYWERSHRLQKDALICLLSGKGAAIFCSITHEPKLVKLEEFEGVALAPPRAFIGVRLASEDPSDVNVALGHFTGDAATTTIVEFPGVLLPAFEFTLKALQQMKQASDLPFAEFLLPTDVDIVDHEVIPPPPAYAMQQGFRFNLGCLTKDGGDLFLSTNAAFDIDVLQSKSTLDQKQAVALVNALTRSLALIQGPPGTGKSYVGEMLIKTLLANKSDRPGRAKGADLGPILCVTYTNHALDQQLEHLLDKGVTQIIRLGSRSKSEALQKLTLNEVSRKEDPTRQEISAWKDAKSELDVANAALEQVIKRTKGHQDIQETRRFLVESYPRHFKDIFDQDEEGWEVYRGGKDPLEFWYYGGSHSMERRSFKVLLADDPHNLSRLERHRLYCHWREEMRKRATLEFVEALTAFRTARSRVDRIKREAKLRCLQQANVIGCTTSGLARNIDLLRRCRSKVMLCEEAGEVLEAHTLTAFLPSVEHAILIGDPLQLRPRIENYQLSAESHQGAKYALDVSLFERLFMPDVSIPSTRVAHTALETQRRMDPSISRLVRDYLYPSLEDHSNVLKYPPVAGMRRRLFWLNHTNLEDGVDDVTSTSYTNSFEVEMVTALVAHLIRQGIYQPDDIAVLTPYLGQLRKLRNRLKFSFEIAVDDRDEDDLERHGLQDEPATGTTNETSLQHRTAIGTAKTALLHALRIATVDNFQGEEAKVVIISLVRSNKQKRCGFLRTSNRINVLLSRAKHGMYIIGNSETSEHVDMWANTTRILKEEGNFGSHLELKCPRHKDAPILVATPDDFVVFSPEGGCNQRCVDSLPCGHACSKSCHALHLHNAVYCMKPCPRSLPGCDHVCPLPCGDFCQPCEVEITLSGDERILPCGHTIDTLPCWEYQDLDKVTCNVKVPQIVPGCKHSVEVRCGTDITSPNFFCEGECGAALGCGHDCRRKCYQCRTHGPNGRPRIDHGHCFQTCGRSFTTCSHSCKAICHGSKPCPLCSQPCDVRCSHSKCSKTCSEPCTPCAEEKCASSCPHAECTMPCAAPCNRLPCSKRCEKSLDCGHQCPSICGEQCPPEEFCHICANEEIKDTPVDYIEFTTYRDIDLDADPCIFPSCGHFLTVSSMDGQMDFSKYYTKDNEGDFAAMASAIEPFSMDEIKSCPQCRGPLRNVARYGMIVRRALLDMATKRFITSTTKAYVDHAENFRLEQERLNATFDDFDTDLAASASDNCTFAGSRASYISSLPREVRVARYASIGKLRIKLAKFEGSTQTEEQPYERVWQAAQNARRRHGATPSFTYDPTVIQTKASLLASCLVLQCDLTLLADFLALRDRYFEAAPLAGKLVLDLSTAIQDCSELAERAGRASASLQQAQALVCLAHFAALEHRHIEGAEHEQRREALRQRCEGALGAAEELRGAHPAATAAVQADIEAVRDLLRTGTFYAPVTSEEMREVWRAMESEFAGTGHWYTCVNGHYFTIGECGLAMEMARCPECGARIGGRNHRAVEGVEHAMELEREMAGLQL